MLPESFFRFLQKHLILVIIICLSLVVRICFISFFMDSQKYYWEDTIHYYTASKNLVTEGNLGTDPERPENDLPYALSPVYPIFLSPFVVISEGNFFLIRLVQELFYVLSSIWIYQMLLIFVKNRFALLGSFIYLFYPFYIYFGGVILTEGIYTPILVGFAFYSVRYLVSGKSNYLYFSVFLLAFLGHIKVQSWSMGLATLIIFLYTNRIFNSHFIKRAVISIFLFILVCLPWGIRNYQLSGSISLPRNYGVDDGESEIEYRFRAKESILSNTFNFFSPSLTGVDSTNKFTSKLYSVISIIAVLPLLLGTILLPLFYRNKYSLLLYLLLLTYALPYIILFARTRFRAPIDFIMIMFLTILFSSLSDRLLAFRHRKVSVE